MLLLNNVGGLPNIDQRSDIYSLGVILYEAICGHNPYGLDDDLSPSQADWIACHIRVPPKPLKEQAGCEKIEDELENMVMKCLAKSPQNRFSDLGELQNAVANIRSVRMGVNYHAQTAPQISNDLEENESGQSTPEVAPDEEEKVSLVSPTSSLEPSKDLELSYASIFATFNKYRLLIRAGIASVPLNIYYRLLIGAGIASVLVSIFAGYNYMNRRQDYLQTQRALANIKDIEKLKTEKEYQECAKQAEQFFQKYSDLHAEVKKVKNLRQNCLMDRDAEARKLAEQRIDEARKLAEQRIDEAKKLAEQSKLKDAISIAAQIPQDMDVYVEAQSLITKWSEKIFQIASNKYQEGKLQEAIEIMGTILAGTDIAIKAQEASQQWNEEWQQNQNHLQAAQKALDERRWEDAINAAKKVSKTDYWQKKQSEQIIQKAEAEIRKYYAPPKPVPPKPKPQPPSTNIPNQGPIPSNAPFPPKDGSSRIEWLCQINPRHPDCSK